ncbi:MAG: Type I Iterative PKS [Chrysothrix sp. TS-e1954]|nr:MAG: Type I Iterative PKS [Chrysothrix sp. TS-e1954]
MDFSNAYHQEPIAIIGFACRLPGRNDTPQRLWEFLKRGEVAPNTVPESRFNIKCHYDGSHRAGTMRPPGGMFLEDINLADFDASFFGTTSAEATAMDPNQRQMLEVVYEGLENAGIPLEKISGTPVACFAGSFASDYGDMQNRDPEDRPVNYIVGIGRSILANRLSHFFNLRGPSVTVDTACSGSLVCLDLACRSIQSGEANAAIVAASNLYLNPDHAIDRGSVSQTHSPTALCHTFDEHADGYVKSEAVSCIIVKKLSDALRDGDPVRTVIRGTSSNSNGRTAGISSPSSDAQADAIRRAYRRAGITNLNETTYLECHGTGTQAGDPAEIEGVGSVFADQRIGKEPLLVGSVKSNVGHSEPAAGNSALIKVIMSIENGIIPGTPSFVKPNPKIDFIRNKVRAMRTAVAWPDEGFPIRRASINSFGYGGSNAHCIIEQADDNARSRFVSSYVDVEKSNVHFAKQGSLRSPYLCVVSANDTTSLKSNIRALCAHLVHPSISVSLSDLAYTLSQRRSQLWHRAFITTESTGLEEKDFSIGKCSGRPPNIAMIFTGQGSQWPQMGRAMVDAVPWTRRILQDLDVILSTKCDPPTWSVVAELTEPRSTEHLRQPELSQTLVIALQICILAVLESWGIRAKNVVGHSSGEISAAYAAGFLDQAGAITAAFYRGRAAQTNQAAAVNDNGMLFAAASEQLARPYVERHPGRAWIACFNSANSVTISGWTSSLKSISSGLEEKGIYTRLLDVDVAYHSPMMNGVGEEYMRMLERDEHFRPSTDRSSIGMYSTVTCSKIHDSTGEEYWKKNLAQPVRFHEALSAIVGDDCPDVILEIGPSSALARPIFETLQSSSRSASVLYYPTWARTGNAITSLFKVAGHLFNIGAPINLENVNSYDSRADRTIVDLPNYSWNRSFKYWHENTASKDWRYKKFIAHELLGSKIPGNLWSAPSWRKNLVLSDSSWLYDHQIGTDVLMPATGFICMAIEAIYQWFCAMNPPPKATHQTECAYRLRNVQFRRAMVLQDSRSTSITVTLGVASGNPGWHDFKIQSSIDGAALEHCTGLIQINECLPDDGLLGDVDLSSLRHPQPAAPWYKLQNEIGMKFGPSFRNIHTIESINGVRTCRTLLYLQSQDLSLGTASQYPLHPTTLDSCFGAAVPATAAGEKDNINDAMVPASVEEVVINTRLHELQEGLTIARSSYTGRGRAEDSKNWRADVSVHDPETGRLVTRISGLAHVKLDVQEREDQHHLCTTRWRPDISFANDRQLSNILKDHDDPMQEAVELVIHKSPHIKVLQISLDDAGDVPTWLSKDHLAARASIDRYDYASKDVQTVVKLREAYKGHQNKAFHILGTKEGPLNELLDQGVIYDLVIIGRGETDRSSLALTIANVCSRLAPQGLVLIAQEVSPRRSVNESTKSPCGPTNEVRVRETNSSIPATDLAAEPISKEYAAALTDPGFSCKKLNFNDNHETLIEELKGSRTGISYLMNTHADEPATINHAISVAVAHFNTSPSVLSLTIQDKLRTSGFAVDPWLVDTGICAYDENPCRIILILDDLSSSTLSNISEGNWHQLKEVIYSGYPILWVTKGAQMSPVTNPGNALINGLSRTIRSEHPESRIMTLDVQAEDSSRLAYSIAQVLRRMGSHSGEETEYAEQEGVLHIPRVVRDTKMNAFRAAEAFGLATVIEGLHETKSQVRLQTEKLGMLQSLTYCQTECDTSQIESRDVEIEVKAVGINFKDVAIAMGLIPGNEHAIGCECAGNIVRLGNAVENSKVGDRVVAMTNGTLANRIQCPVDRVHSIHHEMNPIDAATVPVVFSTAIHALLDLADLQNGQKVLIHSAAGGVGLAAVQLAQYKGAEVYATVGNDKKADFLVSTNNISRDHIFSSRDSRFAKDILRQTEGYGVDVVLNSLTGELLDVSWRLLADNGTMVEIGKKDILDRNMLSMEPFNRNCTFRAFDLSYATQASNELIQRLLKRAFCMIERGQIKPIHPITTYGFDQVVPALSQMRKGEHIGKIVVSHIDDQDVNVPVRPVIKRPRLSHKDSYLIIGGLKGVCGSLAIHLARLGARKLLVMSRSGLNNDASAKVIQDCASHGCSIEDSKGDVGDFEFVRSVFASSSGRRIAGVIQGAMTLMDKTFEAMTCDEFRTVLHAKLTGTWNVHYAAGSELSRPLDFFILLSSTAGIVGNKGQANYAAANAFLDAFAQFRHSKGLCANSVDLGAIKEVGYIAGDSAVAARLDDSIWIPISERVLRQFINYSILQAERCPISPDSRSQLITGIRYPLPSSSELSSTSRFTHLFNPNSEAEDTDVPSHGGQEHAVAIFRAQLASGADRKTLADAVLKLLLDQITELMRLETTIESGKPLISYGVDSLAAVELRGWVKKEFKVSLTTLEVINAASIVELSDKLLSKITS